MIEVLTNDSIINRDDYCRPLQVTDSDHFLTENPYSGRPINNFKWTKVKDVLGKVWLGRTVKDYNNTGVEMEFVRGEIPKSHIL